MKFYTHLILAVAALFLIAACSDDDNTDTNTPSGQNLSGTFSRSCVDETTSSFNTTFSISSGVLTGTDLSYLGVVDCSTAADWQETFTFTLTFIDAVTLASGESVSRTDLTDTATTLTPNTAAGVADLNSRNFGNGLFGITDWAVGVARDVLALNFDGTTRTVFTDKDLLYLDTSVTPNILLFGDTNTGAATDGDGYPSTLDTTDVFTKS